MTDLRKAAEMALDALESNSYGNTWIGDKSRETIAALRQALEQEPWDTSDMAHRTGGLSIGKEWVGLTDDEIDAVLGLGVFNAIRAVESKLRAKNGY